MLRNRLLPQLAIVLLAGMSLDPLASAQTAPPAEPPAYTPTSHVAEPGLPRTPDGRPDLQAVVWAANFFPVFEASPMAATLTVPEAQATKMVDTMVTGFLNSGNLNARIDPEIHIILGDTDGLPLVRGERRTRQVVQPPTGKLPYTPEARAEVKTSDPLEGKGFNDPEVRPVGERCLGLNAPPFASTLTYTRMQFIQAPTYIVIHAEQGDDARIIPFTAVHQGAPPSWLGDSIARWEGDTLVIETVGIRADDRVRTVPNFIVGEKSKVIERFTRLSNSELLYQYTVIDPEVYTAPWLAEYSLHASDTGMFPSPCHEHNYSLPNILKGARVADGKALQARR